MQTVLSRSRLFAIWSAGSAVLALLYALVWPVGQVLSFAGVALLLAAVLALALAGLDIAGGDQGEDDEEASQGSTATGQSGLQRFITLVAIAGLALALIVSGILGPSPGSPAAITGILAMFLARLAFGASSRPALLMPVVASAAVLLLFVVPRPDSGSDVSAGRLREQQGQAARSAFSARDVPSYVIDALFERYDLSNDRYVVEQLELSRVIENRYLELWQGRMLVRDRSDASTRWHEVSLRVALSGMPGETSP